MKQQQQEESTYDDRGHLFIIYGSLPKISCDSWLFPTNINIETDKLSRWTNINEDQIKKLGFDQFPKDQWSESGLRVFKITNWSEMHSYISQPWIGVTGKLRGQSDAVEWYIEVITQYLDQVTQDLKDTIPVNRRAKHLICVPLVGTGAGGGKK
jgi:hypothetical protein